jgi:hypothetical protein
VVGLLQDATGSTRAAFLALGILPLGAAAVMLVLRRNVAFAQPPRAPLSRLAAAARR